jgi:hypothetical protein
LINKANESIEEFQRSSEEIFQKIQSGHPAFTIKTILSNRINELIDIYSKLLISEDIDANQRLTSLLDLFSTFTKEIEKFQSIEIQIEEFIQPFIDEIKIILADYNLIERGNDVVGISELIIKYFIKPYDPTILQDISISDDYIAWKAEFAKIYNEARILHIIFSETMFFEIYEFKQIYGLLLHYYKTLDVIIQEFSFEKYGQLYENLESEESIFTLFYNVYFYLGLTFTKSMERVDLNHFEDVIDIWRTESTDVYSILLTISKRITTLTTRIETEIGEVKNPITLQIIRKENEIINHIIRYAEYLKYQYEVYQLLIGIYTPSSTTNLRSKLEQVIDQISIEFSKDSFQNYLSIKPYTDTWEIRCNLIKTYLTGKIVLAEKFDSSMRLIEDVEDYIWEYTKLSEVSIYTFETLILKGIMYAQIGFKLQKHEYLELAHHEFDKLNDKMETAPRYLKFCYKFFFNILQLLTEKRSFEDVMETIKQYYFEASLYIKSDKLRYEIDTFLEYLENYEKSVIENLPKPTLPFEIEFKNHSLNVGNLFKHYLSLEAYWLHNKYIELKVPVFGTISDTIYNKSEVF